MNKVFDKAALRKEIELFNSRQLLLIGLSCAERMLPSYRQFVKETGWGDESVLRRALDIAWVYFIGEQTRSFVDEKIKNACYEKTPDTEDFPTLQASLALDAANCVRKLISFLQTLNIDEVIDVAEIAISSIDLYVQEMEKIDPSDSKLEERIRLHPIMQRELRNQQEVVDDINSAIEPIEAVRKWKVNARETFQKI